MANVIFVKHVAREKKIHVAIGRSWRVFWTGPSSVCEAHRWGGSRLAGDVGKRHLCQPALHYSSESLSQSELRAGRGQRPAVQHT